ncbi:MAG: ester cyclase [Burkholderiaceae bacterium]
MSKPIPDTTATARALPNESGLPGGTAAGPKWRDLPDFIIGITREIWEGRGIDSLADTYATDVVVRSPMGIQCGNRAVMAATLATLAEFPDRRLLAEDVIWSDDREHGALSSHRLITTGTHLGDGGFGTATRRAFKVRTIADCAVREGRIYDEWLVRDTGGIARQLGLNPRDHARRLIEREGGAAHCPRPFHPTEDVDGGYHGRGNDDPWGARYADTLRSLMAMALRRIPLDYDRAVLTEYPGALSGVSHDAVDRFWLGLRAAFPDAEFEIQHQIGMSTGPLPPRAAIRWSLTGTHAGAGLFGPASAAPVHIMGIAHAEYGPFVSAGSNAPASIRRETVLFDEIAIWKQILMHTGASA